jgi:hypothetical protein
MHTRKSQTHRRQRVGTVLMILAIMIITIIVTVNPLASYSKSLRNQATSKLTSLSAVHFVQGYRLEYVCYGFVQAQGWRWSAVRLVSGATGQQCDWSAVRLVSGATGQRCDWSEVRLVSSATGQQSDWSAVRLVLPNV